LEKVLSHKAKIMCLLRQKPMYIEELLGATGFNNTTISKAIDVLKKVDLVSESTQDKFPRRRYISLTEKGEKVARHLEEVRKILEGS